MLITFKWNLNTLKQRFPLARMFSLAVMHKGVLYVEHHVWQKKKILSFRWSIKVKITLETINFWQNISFSIFKFFLLSYIMKACWWNLINFSKFTKAFIRKEKKHSCSSQWEKKNWEKLETLFYNRLFCKALQNDS